MSPFLADRGSAQQPTRTRDEKRPPEGGLSVGRKRPTRRAYDDESPCVQVHTVSGPCLLSAQRNSGNETGNHALKRGL
jgi:hypothetical protein